MGNAHIFSLQRWLILLLLSCLMPMSYAIDETLDVSFDGDGIVITDIPSITEEIPYDIAIQNDGKIVVVGSGKLAGDELVFVVRYLANGRLDSTFDADGIVITNAVVGGVDKGVALDIQSDGKIVVAGYKTGNDDFLLIRYETDGSLDTNFGTGGIVITDLGSNFIEQASDLLIQSNGKIVVIGYSLFDVALARYNANGNLDPSFGTGGIQKTRISTSSFNDKGIACDQQADGKIVIAALTNSIEDVAVLRYSSSGILDPSFGTNGMTVSSISGNSDRAYAIKVKDTGEILVSGTSNNGSDNDIMLLQYQNNGTLDPNFGTAGVVTIDPQAGNDEAIDLVIQANGQPITVGHFLNLGTTGEDFSLHRFNLDGTADSFFGNNGFLTTAVAAGNVSDRARAAAFQADDKLVVAGAINNAGTYSIGLVRYAPPDTNCPTEGIIYVDADAPIGGNGKSWTNALNSLQTAISLVDSCPGVLEIWVAEGTYHPDPSDRSIAFELREGIDLYGGFNGTESIRSQRNPYLHPTILSGDLLSNDNLDRLSTGDPSRSDNSFHVVLAADGISNATELDGFIIEGGNANGNSSNDKGGGLLCDGANGGSSSPSIKNCFFRYNTAERGGGGIYNDATNGSSSPFINHCLFFRNVVDFDGGAINNDGDNNGLSAPVISHCSFLSNDAAVSGGSIFNNGTLGGLCVPSIENSIFWDGRMQNQTANPSYTNCIIPETSCSVSTMMGSSCSSCLFDSNPFFANSITGDLRLTPCSPAIDAGNNSLSLPEDTVDFAQHARMFGSEIEMGAFEFADTLLPQRYYVDSASTGGNGLSWATAFGSIQEALDIAECIDEVWVTSGTYKPNSALSNDPRTTTFAISNGVKIYGGFDGTESTFADRNRSNPPTILDGDLLGNDNGNLLTGEPTRSENAYHVITILDGRGSQPLIDGFVIRNGNASDSTNFMGGGLFNDKGRPIVRFCTIEQNTAAIGAGLASDLSSGALISHCIIRDNHASGLGGGLFNQGRMSLSNNLVYENDADQGGGLYTVSANLTISQCTFADNTALSEGGALHQSVNTSPGVIHISNSIFWDNSDSGGQDESGQIFSNPFNNVNLSYSCVEGLTGSTFGITYGSGNIGQSPLFEGKAESAFSFQPEDYALKLSSPARNAGQNAAILVDQSDVDEDGNTTELVEIDLAGSNRIQATTVDMGALEGIPPLPVEWLALNAVVEQQDVLIQWQTAQETNNDGFEVQMHNPTATTTAERYLKLGFVEGNGTSNTPHSYQFRVPNLSPDTYYFRLKQIDFNGEHSFSRLVQATITDEALVQTQFYPNPTQEQLFLNIYLPESKQLSILIVDALGKERKVEMNGDFASGSHNLEWNVSEWTEGVYFYRISGGDFTHDGKLVVGR